MKVAEKSILPHPISHFAPENLPNPHVIAIFSVIDWVE
jgi:hypothetical protein